MQTESKCLNTKIYTHDGLTNFLAKRYSKKLPTLPKTYVLWTVWRTTENASADRQLAQVHLS